MTYKDFDDYKFELNDGTELIAQNLPNGYIYFEAYLPGYERDESKWYNHEVTQADFFSMISDNGVKRISRYTAEPDYEMPHPDIEAPYMGHDGIPVDQDGVALDIGENFWGRNQ